MDREQSELIEGEVIVNNDLPEVETHHALHPELRHSEPLVAQVEAASRGPVSVSSGSTPEAIRTDIERTRSQMDNTIDLLSARLKPRHLMDDVMRIFQSPENGTDEGAARRSIREAGVQAADKLKQNPVPATLIGAGLAWLLFQDRSKRSSPTSYDPYAGGTGTTSSPAASGFGDSAREAVNRTSEKVSEAAGVAATRTREAKNAVGDMLESAPLAFGVGALAAGLLAGLVIPATKAEQQLMGEAARDVKDTIADTANDLRLRGANSSAFAQRPASKADRLWDR
jgi:hypothetical protein